MKRAILVAAAMSATTLLSGCATMVSGDHQSIHVQAVSVKTKQPIPGATCTLTNGKAASYVTSKNPDVIKVSRHLGGLHVSCHAKGYFQQSVATGSSFNAWTLGNILFWPGAVVDLATGAAEKYPSYITVVMTQNPNDVGKPVVIKASE